MQRFGVVAVADELVGYLLRLHLRTAEDDGVYLGIVIHYALQRKILVLGIHEIVCMIHILRSFVARPYNYLLMVVQILACDAFNLFRHRGGEEQCAPILGQAFKYGVDAVCKTHVEHLVSLVEHYCLRRRDVCHATLYKIDKSAGRGNDDVCAFTQLAYLRIDRRAAVNGRDTQPLDIFAEVFQVVADLETKFSCRRHHHRLDGAPGDVEVLEQRKAEGCRLACARLGESYDVAVGRRCRFRRQEMRNHSLLYGHRGNEAHLVYCPA